MGETTEQEYWQAMFDQGERQIAQLVRIRKAVEKMWNVVALGLILGAVGIVLALIATIQAASR